MKRVFHYKLTVNFISPADAPRDDPPKDVVPFEKVSSTSEVCFGRLASDKPFPRSQTFAVARPTFWLDGDGNWTGVMNDEQLRGKVCGCRNEAMLDTFVDLVGKTDVAAIIVSKMPAIECNKAVFCLPERVVTKLYSWRVVDVVLEEIEGTAANPISLATEESENGVEVSMAKSYSEDPALRAYDPPDQQPTRSYASALRDSLDKKEVSKSKVGALRERFEDAPDDETLAWQLEKEERDKNKKEPSGWFGGLKNVANSVTSSVSSYWKSEPELMRLLKEKGWGEIDDYSAYRKALDIIHHNSDKKCDDDTVAAVANWLKNNTAGPMRLAVCMELWLVTRGAVKSDDELFNEILSSIGRMNINDKKVTGLKSRHSSFRPKLKPHQIVGKFFPAMVVQFVGRGGEQYVEQLLGEQSTGPFWVATLFYWDDSGMLFPNQMDWELWENIRAVVRATVMNENMASMLKLIGSKRVESIALCLQTSISGLHSTFFDFPGRGPKDDAKPLEPHTLVWIAKLLDCMVQGQGPENAAILDELRRVFGVLSAIRFQSNEQREKVVRGLATLASYHTRTSFSFYPVIAAASEGSTLQNVTMKALCVCFSEDLKVRQNGSTPQLATALTHMLQTPIGTHLMQDRQVLSRVVSFTDRCMKVSTVTFGEKLPLLAILHAELGSGAYGESWNGRKDDEIKSMLVEALLVHSFKDRLFGAIEFTSTTSDAFVSEGNSRFAIEASALVVNSFSAEDILQNVSVIKYTLTTLDEKQMGSFRASLYERLLRALVNVCSTFDSAAAVLLELAFGKEATEDTITLAKHVVSKSFSQWKPPSLAALANLGSDAIDLCSRSLKVDSRKHPMSVFKDYIVEMVGNWISQFEGEALLIEDLEMGKLCAVSQFWELMNRLHSKHLPSVSDIQPKIDDWNNLFHCIMKSLATPSDWNCSLVGLLKAYDCSEGSESEFGRIIAIYHSAAEKRHVAPPNGRPYDARLREPAHHRVELKQIRRDACSAETLRSYWPALSVCAYFLEHKSLIFERGIGEHLEGQVDLEGLRMSVDATLESIRSLFQAECDYASVKKAFAAIPAQDALKHECSVLLERKETGLSQANVNRFLVVCSLSKIEAPLQEFLNFCNHLKFDVVHDTVFSELKSMEATLKTADSSVTVETVHNMCLRLHSTLHPEYRGEQEVSSTVVANLDRLAEVFRFLGSFSRHSEVWVFAREMKWFGKDGLERFYKEHENVTNVLLGNTSDSFYMTVLDALEPTMRVVAALGGLQKEANILTMLEKVSSNSDMTRWMENDSYGNLVQVQGSLSLLRGWFCDGVDEIARVNGDFESIRGNGVYSVCLSSGMSLQLRYTPGSDGTAEPVTAMGQQLDDLVERVGMIQHDEPAAARAVEGFLEQYRLLQAAVINFMESNAFGYPLHEVAAVSCRAGEDHLGAARKILERSQACRQAKDSWLGSTRKKYPTSMLFWTAELKEIHACLDRASNAAVLQHLVAILSRLSSNLTHDQVLSVVLRHVGRQENDGWLVASSRFIEDVHLVLGAPFQQIMKQVGLLKLHTLSCTEGHDNDAILGLLQHIYKDRLPVEFEILNAREDTSTNELDLFLLRAKVFTNNTFTIINVDKLSGKNLEKVLGFISDRENKSCGVQLHCIQQKVSMLHTSNFVEGSEWGDCATDDQSSCWKRYIVNAERFESVDIISSASCGGGKTRLIRKELQQCLRGGKEVGAVTVHEGSTIDSLTNDVIAAFTQGGGRQKAMHLSLMCMPESDGESHSKWLETINRFVFSLLVLGVIRNSDASKSFHSEGSSWAVYVELPSHHQLSGQSAALDWLRKHIPVLLLCGSFREPDERIFIDDETRRVCTYLRAYENGTIDRKFKPGSGGKKVVFVLDRSDSMNYDVGNGQSALSAATDCALRIFDSHLNTNDMVGVFLFNRHTSMEVPIQMVRDEGHKAVLRTSLDGIRNSASGGTYMYPALQSVVEESQQTHGEFETWIICLTDGCTSGGDTQFRASLEGSSDNLHVLLIGVNLHEHYEAQMRLLCNKYSHEHRPTNKGQYISSRANIDSLAEAFETAARSIPVSETFELDGRVSDGECRRLIKKYAPNSIPAGNMQQFMFWVRFLHRRVMVLDSNDSYNYNETCEHLGSSLMEIMLFEVERLLGKDLCCDWINKNYTQLIYDFENPEAPEFRLLCTSPKNLDRATREKYESLALPGFFVPSETQLKSTEMLCDYLSKAMNIPVSGSDCLNCVNKQGFVLTLDFTVKMLSLHERVGCGVPAVLEGETGVSKTALTKMYSILLNLSCSLRAERLTAIDLDAIEQELLAEGHGAFEGDCALSRLDWALTSASSTSRAASTELSALLRTLICDKCDKRSAIFQDMPEGFSDDKTDSVRKLLQWFASSQIEPTFFEINVDASMSDSQISELFEAVRHAARKLKDESSKVIVFFDEINVSKVLGLFKEIVVDRSLNGEALEDNIIAVAACNPVRPPAIFRGAREKDLGACWASGHYQVLPLPPSMEQLKWSFGSLNSAQEKDFISRRLDLMGSSTISPALRMALTTLISTSQETIRQLAESHLAETVFKEVQVDPADLKQRAASVVSLRDIQRVFSLFGFFNDQFSIIDDTSLSPISKQRKAMILAVAIVYYMRLDANNRLELLQAIKSLPNEQLETESFQDVLDAAMQAVISDTAVPPGIAITKGLTENLFMTLVCSLSRTPLMIVGPPGSSKTLSVNTLADNANGEDSLNAFYRDFPRLSLFHYQCSKETSSREIAAVFHKASQRQEKVDPAKQRCVVFMDEAGLPEEERESLKVLHYLLEGHMSMKAAVGFVAITNHILDAAKSNRCVVLLRPEPDRQEMTTIANGLLFDKTADGTVLTREVEVGESMVAADVFAQQLCTCYAGLVHGELGIKEADTFFGLRDFIYFLRSLKSMATVTTVTKMKISTASFVRAIERNFNGLERRSLFHTVTFFLQPFFSNASQLRVSVAKFASRPLDVIQEALEDNSACVDQEKRARFTLIIDCSEDDSIMRLLQMAGLLDFSKKSLFKLSHLPEEVSLEKMRLISGVKFAAGQGKVALLSQTELVNESFYDLFNQHFREVKNRDGQRMLFTNIAVGGISRRCQVHDTFECIVHVRSSQVKDLPAPFLNRFEKYRLDVVDVMNAGWSRLGGMARVMQRARSQTKLLLAPLLEENGLFGWAKDERTLDSVFVAMLPPWALSPQEKSRDEFILNGSRSETLADVLVNFLHTVTSVSIGLDEMDISLRISKKHLSQSQQELLERLACEGIGSSTNALQVTLNGLMAEPGDGALDNLCQSVLQVALSRYAVSCLLQLATPEAIFARRHDLPSEIFNHYLATAHSSLKELIKSGLRDVQLSARPKLIVAFSRTDAFSLAIPTVSTGQDPACLDVEAMERIAGLVSENFTEVVVERLELLRSEAKFRNSLTAWIQHNEKKVYVLLVDMKERNAVDQCNYVRMCVEQHLSSTANKLFLLLLHYPPTTFLKSGGYPALCLGRWRHVFLDGVGRLGPGLGTNQFMRLSCEIEDAGDSEMKLLGFLEELLPRSLSHVACRQVLSPRQLARVSDGAAGPFQAQLVALKALFCQKVGSQTIQEIVCKKFAREWMEQALPHATKLASRALLEGTTQLSMGTAIQSTLVKAFETFVLLKLHELNRDQNMEVLFETQHGENVRHLFGYILESLPAVPFAEILLHQDVVSRSHLQKEARSTPKFPFFALVSSYINECLELSEKGMLVKNGSSFKKLQRSGTAKSLFDKSMILLETLKDDSDDEDGQSGSHRAALLLGVIDMASKNSSSKGIDLFQLYMQQFIENATGCAANSVAMLWLDGELGKVTQDRNILSIHCVHRYHQIEFTKLVSWSCTMQQQSLVGTQILDGGGSDSGRDTLFMTNLFFRMLDYFETSLSTGVGSCSEWSRSLSSFVRQVSSGLVEDSVLRQEHVQKRIRVLVIILVLTRVGAAKELVYGILSKFYDEELSVITVGDEADISIGIVFSSVQATDDTRATLLWHFFSPHFMKVMPGYNQEDLCCLMTIVDKELCSTRDHQLAIALIRRACSIVSESTSPLGFSNQALGILSGALTCRRGTEFSPAGIRTFMPHFIPLWLQSVQSAPTRDGTDGRDTPRSSYQCFFSSYKHSFEGNISQVIFDLILSILLRQAQAQSSSDLLLLFCQDIEAEAEVRAGEDRLECIVGSPLGAMLADARAICFVAKVAQELAQRTEASALVGAEGETGMLILSQIMHLPNARFKDFFFSLIMHHSGGSESTLAALVRQGGQLHGQPWCRSLQNGVPSSRGRYEAELETARENLQDATREEERKSREIRICPHCGAHFMVDAVECGTFYCGRDAHGLNGGPAVGGRAVSQVYGCNRQFPLDRAGRYEVNEALLRPLQADVAVRAADFRAFELAESTWREMLNFELPILEFCICNPSSSPVPAAVVMNANEMSDAQTRHLQILLDGSMGFLDQLSVLPDLIEFYIWVQNTFKYLVTREEALTNSIGDIMQKDRLHKRFDRMHASHLVSLWERLSSKMNLMLADPNFKVLWQCEEIEFCFKSIQEAPLMALLSEGSDPSDGNDFLFLVIDSIVAKYNRFAERFLELSEEDIKLPSIHPKIILAGSAGSAAIRMLPLLPPQELGAIAMASWHGDTKSFDFEGLDHLLREGLANSDRPALIESPISCLREQFSFRVDLAPQKNIRSKFELVFPAPSGLLFAREQDLQLVLRIQNALRRLGVTEGDRGLKGPLRVNFQGLESHQQVAGLLTGLCDLFDLLLSEGATEFHGMSDGVDSANFGMSFEDFLSSLGFPELNTAQWKLLASLNAEQVFELSEFLAYQLATESYIFSHAEAFTKDPLSEQTQSNFQDQIKGLCTRQGAKATLEKVDSFTNHVLLYYKNPICEETLKSSKQLAAFLIDSNFCDADDTVLDCLSSDVSVRNYVAVLQAFHQVRLWLLLQQSAEGEHQVGGNCEGTLSPKQAKHNCWLWEGCDQAQHFVTGDVQYTDEDEMKLWFITNSGSESGLGSALKADTEAVESAPDIGTSCVAKATIELIEPDSREREPLPAPGDSRALSAVQIQRWWRSYLNRPKATIETPEAGETSGKNPSYDEKDTRTSKVGDTKPLGESIFANGRRLLQMAARTVLEASGGIAAISNKSAPRTTTPTPQQQDMTPTKTDDDNQEELKATSASDHTTTARANSTDDKVERLLAINEAQQQQIGALQETVASLKANIEELQVKQTPSTESKTRVAEPDMHWEHDDTLIRYFALLLIFASFIVVLYGILVGFAHY